MKLNFMPMKSETHKHLFLSLCIYLEINILQNVVFYPGKCLPYCIFFEKRSEMQARKFPGSSAFFHCATTAPPTKKGTDQAGLRL